jgi:hypothetical protein
MEKLSRVKDAPVDGSDEMDYHTMREAQVKHFQDMGGAALLGDDGLKLDQLLPTPKLRGKIIVVNGTVKDLVSDDELRRFPVEMHAYYPHELETVVRIEHRHDVVGTYSDFSEARVAIVRVSIIDWPNKRLLYRTDFRGTRPPDTVLGSGGPYYGSSPLPEAYQWLLALPRE